MSEDRGDGMWWLFTDVVANHVGQWLDSDPQPWPLTAAARNDSGRISLKALAFLGLSCDIGLVWRAVYPTRMDRDEQTRLMDGMFAVGLAVSQNALECNETQWTADALGFPGQTWSPEEHTWKRLTRLGPVVQWVTSHRNRVRVTTGLGTTPQRANRVAIPRTEASSTWLARVPWYRCAWLGATWTPTRPECGVVIDRTTVPPSCDVPEALSDFLAARDPLSDLDAALLFAESYLRGDPEDASAVREALRKVCGSSSRWAAGRLLAERAAYGAATGVEFRWLDESEAREALRAAEQRSMEPWPDARHLVSTLRQVPGVGTAAFDASTVRNRRKRHVWEAEALIERASHILGVAPNASDEEIRLRVADLVERLSAPGPLATAGELVEFAASTERERAQLAAAVLLANLHTKNS